MIAAAPLCLSLMGLRGLPKGKCSLKMWCLSYASGGQAVGSVGHCLFFFKTRFNQLATASFPCRQSPRKNWLSISVRFNTNSSLSYSGCMGLWVTFQHLMDWLLRSVSGLCSLRQSDKLRRWKATVWFNLFCLYYFAIIIFTRNPWRRRAKTFSF